MHCFRLILIICLLSIVGCKSEDPNPELKDPIFKVLVEQTNALKSELEAEKKKLEEAIVALEKADLFTPERKMALKDIQNSKIKVQRLEQTAAYAEIRKDRRKVEGRRSYKIAFAKGEEWPDPKEFEAFETEQRLRAAPRSWATRVPKLQDRISAAWPKPGDKPKKKEAPKGEEGEGKEKKEEKEE